MSAFVCLVILCVCVVPGATICLLASFTPLSLSLSFIPLRVYTSCVGPSGSTLFPGVFHTSERGIPHRLKCYTLTHNMCGVVSWWPILCHHALCCGHTEKSLFAE